MERLAAENEALRVERDGLAARAERLEEAIRIELENPPDYNDQAMGCGLEDKGITDRYEAMRYGWDEAIDRYGEGALIDPMLEETPAQSVAHIKAQAVTDAMEYALDQVGSDGSADDCIEAITEHLENLSEGEFSTVGSTGNTWRSIKAQGAREALQRAMQTPGFSDTVVRVDRLEAVIADMESGK